MAVNVSEYVFALTVCRYLLIFNQRRSRNSDCSHPPWHELDFWVFIVVNVFPDRIFSLLSAILLLGNIRYKKKTYRDDCIDICNPEVLPTISELLEVTVVSE